MSKTRSHLSIYYRAILVLIVFAVIVYLFVRNINIFRNVVLAMVGFGAVVLVHEFGHFIVAKLSNITVEAFSIFMPPILLGVRKTANGFRIRILPELFPKDDDEKGEGLLGFSVGKKGKGHPPPSPGETEYRIGLIPFGGYVKLLGQEDTGPVKATDDPRSFANKPVSTRVPVIAAGVLFNVISAVVIFMVVFLWGIKLPPAIVGGVVPNSPAARAGIKPGDEIIEIAGKSKDLDFSNIMIAAALSDKGEEISLKVRHDDRAMPCTGSSPPSAGSEEYYALVAEQLPGESIKDFGILQPLSLIVAEVSDANALLDKTDLRAGDRIRAINGKEVHNHWELQEIVERAFVPEVTILAERADETGKTKTIETKIKLALNLPKGMAKPIKRDVSKTEPDLGNVYSIVPRLRIIEVSEQLKAEGTEKPLKSDDIIVAVGDIENPTFEEMRTVTEEYKDKQLPLKVLRIKNDSSEEIVTVNIVPHWSKERKEVVIGIEITLDLEHAIVADTVSDEDGKKKLDIPRGALITAINGAPVSNFFEIARKIGQNIATEGSLHQARLSRERIMIGYRLSDGTVGEVTLDIETDKDFVPIKSIFAEFIPFNRLERLYQAKGPIDAIAMGYRRTVMFIVQTYVTLQRLIGGLVSPKELMGPVGIIAFSYRIVAEQPLVNYFYFLGLISACIAVINFLPLPPFDGGIVVLLFIEKIKGSALSERTQGVIAYAGWALVGGLLLYVTLNDIVRNFFS